MFCQECKKYNSSYKKGYTKCYECNLKNLKMKTAKCIECDMSIYEGFKYCYGCNKNKNDLKK